jgi:hypothetical protein
VIWSPLTHRRVSAARTLALALVLLLVAACSGSPPGSTAPQPTRATGLALGVFVPPGPSGDVYSAVDALVGHLGSTPDVIATFTNWQTPYGAFTGFPTRFTSFVAAKGATPMVTWQPSRAGAGTRQPAFSWAELASGRYDRYVTAWADQAKAYAGPVYVRLMQEMNIPTYPWSYRVNGNSTTAGFVAAWQHIVGIFRAQGATNVQFVWCVATTVGSAAPLEFLPDDNSLSWVALDGYNKVGTSWRSFSQIFQPYYSLLVHASDRPVMIAETASVESQTRPGAKARWIAQSFLRVVPTRFPRVRAVVYFDAPGLGYSYPLTSSSTAFAAFRRVAAAALYRR